MYVSCIFCFAILMKYSYGSFFFSPIPNPLKIIANTAEKISGVAKPETFIGKIHNGIFHFEKGFLDGLHEVIGTPVDLEQLTFHLVTAKDIKVPSKIDFYKPEKVARTQGKIIFLIHGWTKSMNSSWYHDLTEILIRKDPDTHVVQIDWRVPAADKYPFAAYATESAGDYVGIFINVLVTQYRVPLENIILIGHSLGGQIVGWAGKKYMQITSKKVPRIIALDPAGPLFIQRPTSRRLNKNDADVVMVVHTDADKLGFPLPCGTIDFFPNSGYDQPGCWTIDLAKISTYVGPVFCDHQRVLEFFLEAVNNTGSFLARKCATSWFTKKTLCLDEVVAMGDLTTKAKGSFYLETNSRRPYSKPLPEL